MSTQPTRPGTKTEIDAETRHILDERILTIEADAKDSVDSEDAREEIRKLRHSLKQPVLR